MTTSPAMAIAWELGRRHRWGMILVAAYISALAAWRLVATPGGFSSAQSLAFGLVVPLILLFMYFMAVFSFGLSGDLAARQSMYPARMFTLPVSSAALAGWPMFFGSAATMLLWLASRFFGRWPAGAPVWWPLLLGPALLAWTQALTWMPYPLAGMRVAMTVLWLAIIDAASARETAVANDVTRREYAQCASGASVVLYSVRDGGHTWPGSDPMPEWFAGRTTASIDATEAMWRFFTAHRALR
jgi:hypothetical protein